MDDTKGLNKPVWFENCTELMESTSKPSTWEKKSNTAAVQTENNDICTSPGLNEPLHFTVLWEQHGKWLIKPLMWKVCFFDHLCFISHCVYPLTWPYYNDHTFSQSRYLVSQSLFLHLKNTISVKSLKFSHWTLAKNWFQMRTTKSVHILNLLLPLHGHTMQIIFQISKYYNDSHHSRYTE